MTTQEAKAIINHKKYTVYPVFNSMSANWHFVDKHRKTYLVDAQDAQEWAEDQNIVWEGVETVIRYAKTLAGDNDGVFYCKII
mgnify:CR=1 FL=1